MAGLQQLIAVPVSTVDGRLYEINPEPLRWRQGKPAPYLWDRTAHPKVNGVHILGTDGTVRQPARLADFAGSPSLK